MIKNSTSSRANVCEALDFFAQRHPEQRSVADTIRQFILSTPDCFHRTHQAGHITGSAWLVNPQGNKVLLTLHHKLGRWLQPGGHADGNSNPMSVALQEATEESGLQGITALSQDIFDIDIHRIPARPATGEPAHYHYDIRYLLKAPHENYSISEESDDLAWWAMNDFTLRQEELDESVLRMARRYFSDFAQSEHTCPKDFLKG